MGFFSGLLGFGLLATALFLGRAQGEPINILYLAEQGTTVPERALDATVEYFKSHTDEAEVGEVHKVFVDFTKSPTAMVEELCVKVDTIIKSQASPHIALDMTMTGLASQASKGITHALAIPTVTGSYGELNDWGSLSLKAEEYLVQVNPPGDFIPEAMRSLVRDANLTDVGVIYDNTIRISHRIRSLFRNTNARYKLWKMNSESAESLPDTLDDFQKSNYRNLFVLGQQGTIEAVLKAAAEKELFNPRMYRWFVVSKEKFDFSCNCDGAFIVQLYPDMESALKGSSPDLSQYGLADPPQVDNAFYFELMVQTLRTVNQLMQNNKWPSRNYTTTETYNNNHRPREPDVQLRWSLKTNSEKPLVTQLKVDTNGNSWMEFSIKLVSLAYDGGASTPTDIGSWQVPGKLILPNGLGKVEEVHTKKYKVVVVLQPPFVMKWREGYYGYCIDMMDEIKKVTPGFDYEITQEAEGYGFKEPITGQWDGMVGALLNLEADIALGAMSVMAEREQVIDYTVPFYGLVGITIMMKRIPPVTTLFKFLTVLETDVWFCIVGAYFFTSILLWVFDRWSPYSYQNNKDKFHDDDEKRVFNLKECLWFCMTSLTPQGGGEAPKNLSGRLVAATWWLFGFIIIASYTANLAAFLTVSRLETPIENLEDLSRQYKTQYAPIFGTVTHKYFERMSGIEHSFYEIWKDMSLNDSLGEVERSKLAVWDYPISDRYTKMWQAMSETKLQPNYDTAVEKVRNSTLHGEGFALLDEGTVIDYATLTNCDLMKVGPEFSKRPFAIGTQKGTHLKATLSFALMELKKMKVPDNLYHKWWKKNPKKKKCPRDPNLSDGISLPNIGGVFLMIFMGLGLGIVTLIIEFCWYKYRMGGLKPGMQLKDASEGSGGGKGAMMTTTRNPFLDKTNFGSQLTRERSMHLAPVDNAW